VVVVVGAGSDTGDVGLLVVVDEAAAPDGGVDPAVREALDPVRTVFALLTPAGVAEAVGPVVGVVADRPTRVLPAFE
jgi:hypothetical protein